MRADGVAVLDRRGEARADYGSARGGILCAPGERVGLDPVLIWVGCRVLSVYVQSSGLVDHALVSMTLDGYNAFSRSLSVSGFCSVGAAPVLMPAESAVSRGALVADDDVGVTDGEKSADGPRGMGMPPLRGVVGGLDAPLCGCVIASSCATPGQRRRSLSASMGDKYLGLQSLLRDLQRLELREDLAEHCVRGLWHRCVYPGGHVYVVSASTSTSAPLSVLVLGVRCTRAVRTVAVRRRKRRRKERKLSSAPREGLYPLSAVQVTARRAHLRTTLSLCARVDGDRAYRISPPGTFAAAVTRSSARALHYTIAIESQNAAGAGA